MHYLLEIVMPPADDVEQAVTEILTPFNENLTGEAADEGYPKFWDWWVIGGYWSGNKVEFHLGEERIRVFRQALVDAKVTQSGFVAGKPSLQPASQIPMVDAMWREHFPDSGLTICPLFDHSNDQYGNEGMFGDICRLDEMPDGYTAPHVIIAGPGYLESCPLQAHYMTQQKTWNGVSYLTTDFDGKVSTAIEQHVDCIASRKDEWRDKLTPQPDWLVVTVDYHS